MWNKIKELVSKNKTLSFFTFANLTNNVISILSGILSAQWLLPEELGAFNAFTIFTSYIIMVQIGIPSGLSRQLSFYYGKNDKEKANELLSTSKYFLLLVSLIVLCCCILSSLYFLMTQNYQFSIGALVIGFTSFQGIYVSKYLKILYRTENHFIKLAKINLINCLINLISMILVYHYLFYGLCIRAILTVLGDWFFTERWKPMHAKASFNWSNFKALSNIGMPIYFVANIYDMWPTFQRSFILSVLGAKGLGLYSLASIVQGMLNTYNNSISSITFPLMSKAYGEGKKIKELILIPFRTSIISLIVYFLILIIGWPLLPYIVNLFLPNYTAGVPAAQWMFVVALVSVFGVYSNVFMVIQKNHHRLVSYVVGIFVWFLFLKIHSIQGIRDLVIFSQSILVGLLGITICDFIFLFMYFTKDSNNFIQDSKIS